MKTSFVSQKKILYSYYRVCPFSSWYHVKSAYFICLQWPNCQHSNISRTEYASLDKIALGLIWLTPGQPWWDWTSLGGVSRLQKQEEIDQLRKCHRGHRGCRVWGWAADQSHSESPYCPEVKWGELNHMTDTSTNVHSNYWRHIRGNVRWLTSCTICWQRSQSWSILCKLWDIKETFCDDLS